MEKVEIEWIDSVTLTHWQLHENMQRFAEKDLEVMTSVGYLLHESDECVVIVQSLSEDCKQQGLKIPRVAIRRITKLKCKR